LDRRAQVRTALESFHYASQARRFRGLLAARNGSLRHDRSDLARGFEALPADSTPIQVTFQERLSFGREAAGDEPFDLL
jgi:hypothetical protein